MRKHRAGQRDVPLEHAGEPVADLGGGRIGADPDGAGHVGGAIEILPARIDQIDAVGLDLAVRVLADPVVRDRRVRPRPADRVERQVFQQSGLVAPRLQLRCRRQFGLGAAGRGFAQPFEEATECRPVACLGGAVTGLLGGILYCFGQHARIAQLDDRRVRCFQRGEDRVDRAFGIDPDALASKIAQRGDERLARVDSHRVAEMRADLAGQLALGHEQIGGAVGVDQREAQRHRRPLDIGAADVEQPGQRIERGDDHGVKLLLAQPFGNRGTLFLARPACVFIGVDCRRSGRGFGPILPDGIDRIGGYRDQLCPAFGQRLVRGADPRLAVEPRVVTDSRTRRGVLAEPVGDAGLRHALVIPEPAIDLIADLQGIAPVDEHRRPLAVNSIL